MTRMSAALAVLFLGACVPPIERPFVAALRYADDPPTARAPTEDAPFRTSAPASEDEPAMPRLDVEPFTLGNGLHGFVVERHGFPMFAARLVIDTSAVEEAISEGGRPISWPGVFLRAPEGLVQTAGGCGTVQCFVASRGTSDQLGIVLGRIVARITREDRPETFYAQRLDELAPSRLARSTSKVVRDPAPDLRNAIGRTDVNGRA